MKNLLKVYVYLVEVQKYSSENRTTICPLVISYWLAFFRQIVGRNGSFGQTLASVC